mgnify:CR=1 FL=1
MSNLVGQIILDRYQVHSFLGRGGMAEVYKVWDNQRSTYLAMKVLHDKLAQNPLFLGHFRQEAETLSKLEHPNIVRFYGFKQDASRSFILMDFIEGETLKARITKKGAPFSLEEIKGVLHPLFGALQFAHNQGMVHCDIKPANILIDKKGTALLSDFGIARAANLDSRSLTSSGTPAYMAPEQVHNQPPMPETDIYALGVVLFEMLTGGYRPFTGSQAQITGRTGEKIRWEHLHSPPPSLYRWNPALDPALYAVVMKCLAKNASHRYHSALDLLNALKLIRGSTANEKDFQTPPPGSLIEREKEIKKDILSAPKQRKGAALWIVASLFLIAMAVAVVSIFSPSSPPSGSSFGNSSGTTGITPVIPVVETNTPFIQFLVRPYDQARDKDAQYLDIPNGEPLMQPGHATWRVDFPANTKIYLPLGWCATDKEILRQNLLHIEEKVSIDGHEISLSKFAVVEGQDTRGLWCKSYNAIVSGLERGTHTYIRSQHFSQAINDGMDTYPAGDYIMEYLISVE